MAVLVALDHSDPAWKALEYAIREHPDAEIDVLHVINPFEGTFGDDGYAYEYVMEARREEAESLLEEAADLAKRNDASITTEVSVGRPAREIVDYVDEHGIDHVIVGSHGRSGVSRVLLGSVAELIVRRSPAPVTVVR